MGSGRSWARGASSCWGGWPSPRTSLPLCSAGAVTTYGAECLPTGGVPRTCLPDHRCAGGPVCCPCLPSCQKDEGPKAAAEQAPGPWRSSEHIEGPWLFLRWAHVHLPGWGGGQRVGTSRAVRVVVSGSSQPLRVLSCGLQAHPCLPLPNRPAAHPSSRVLPQPDRAGPLALPPGEADSPRGGAATPPPSAPAGQCWKSCNPFPSPASSTCP